MGQSVSVTSLQRRNKRERAIDTRDLTAEELRDWKALPSSPTPRLGVETVSDFQPVLRTKTESPRVGGLKGYIWPKTVRITREFVLPVSELPRKY
jgi:hypothetical protein